MKKYGKILAVDDNQDLLKSLQRMLKFDFDEFYSSNDPKNIPSILSSKEIDVVLLDMNFTEGDQSGRDGLYWLKRIKQINESIIVILITAYGEVELAVKAMQEGATNFVTKPWEPQKLIATLQNAIELRRTKLKIEELKKSNESVTQEIQNKIDPIIGNSEALKHILNTVQKVAKTDANVLILGENGTGKELVAREIHNKSERSKKVFLSVDLNTLNENIFESELFGHVKGAFTDAKENKIGRVEAASGGTLFLDEIGNLSINLQSKLLTVIQNREFTPVGSSKSIKFDVRLICATNKNIKEMIKNQIFRDDLYFRINTIEITNPALRDRNEDIILIADYFLKKYSARYNKNNIRINAAAYNSLLKYKWPGNIRELKHTIEKAVILNDDGIIKSDDLFGGNNTLSENNDLFTLNLESLEKSAIEKAVEDAKGNISKASKILGISRTSLYSKMTKHGI
ncbi:MAG: sigma-54-dependent Fis family transcriptional regulator [Bacteroidales bacterium]|nr:sigma-54-dependent Fis family transcriptional regulator [Bacteroidales bacterium]